MSATNIRWGAITLGGGVPNTIATSLDRLPDAPTARITPSPLYLRINATSSFKSCSGGAGFLNAEAEG